MSHTAHRRGLDPATPSEEIIVLAMISKQHRQDEGIRDAMKALAQKMIDHKPHQWLSHNFIALDIPQLGSKQTLLRWMHRVRLVFSTFQSRPKSPKHYHVSFY